MTVLYLKSKSSVYAEVNVFYPVQHLLIMTETNEGQSCTFCYDQHPSSRKKVRKNHCNNLLIVPVDVVSVNGTNESSSNDASQRGETINVT